LRLMRRKRRERVIHSFRSDIQPRSLRNVDSPARCWVCPLFKYERSRLYSLTRVVSP
jgi:hypothetical protein